MKDSTKHIPIEKREKESLPIPTDAPLLTFRDVACYLRLTPAAVRTIVNGRTDGSDGELGDRLRSWMVRLSPHRRYIKRKPFMEWLKNLAA